MQHAHALSYVNGAPALQTHGRPRPGAPLVHLPDRTSSLRAIWATALQGRDGRREGPADSLRRQPPRHAARSRDGGVRAAGGVARDGGGPSALASPATPTAATRTGLAPPSAVVAAGAAQLVSARV